MDLILNKPIVFQRLGLTFSRLNIFFQRLVVSWTLDCEPCCKLGHIGWENGPGSVTRVLLLSLRQKASSWCLRSRHRLIEVAQAIKPCTQVLIKIKHNFILKKDGDHCGFVSFFIMACRT